MVFGRVPSIFALLLVGGLFCFVFVVVFVKYGFLPLVQLFCLRPGLRRQPVTDIKHNMSYLKLVLLLFVYSFYISILAM